MNNQGILAPLYYMQPSNPNHILGSLAVDVSPHHSCPYIYQVFYRRSKHAIPANRIILQV